MNDEVQTSSDPKKVSEQKKRAKDSDRQAIDDLRTILQTPHGRRFMRALLADCGEHRSSFHTNNAVMAFNEGTRNVGLKLKAQIIRACPEYLVELLGAPRSDRDASPSSADKVAAP